MVENHDSNRIRRSNSASSSLGLSVLLDVDKKSYNDRSLNDYHGFKVISTLENFFFFTCFNDPHECRFWSTALMTSLKWVGGDSPSVEGKWRT